MIDKESSPMGNMSRPSSVLCWGVKVDTGEIKQTVNSVLFQFLKQRRLDQTVPDMSISCCADVFLLMKGKAKESSTNSVINT